MNFVQTEVDVRAAKIQYFIFRIVHPCRLYAGVQHIRLRLRYQPFLVLILDPRTHLSSDYSKAVPTQNISCSRRQEEKERRREKTVHSHLDPRTLQLCRELRCAAQETPDDVDVRPARRTILKRPRMRVPFLPALMVFCKTVTI